MKDWSRLLKNIESNTKRGSIGYITLPSERPSPRTKQDQRHFEFFDKSSFNKIAKTFGWKIIKTGTFTSINGKPIWHWFIVKLP